MTRPDHLLRLLRLACAMLALGVMMVGSVDAARQMAPGAGHHRSMAAETTEGGHAEHGVAMGEHEGVGEGMRGEHAPSSPLAHLCCVLSQLLVTPLSLPALEHPAAQMAMLIAAPVRLQRGLVPAIPVPPPRLG